MISWGWWEGPWQGPWQGPPFFSSLRASFFFLLQMSHRCHKILSNASTPPSPETQKKTRTVSPGKVKCSNGTEFWWIVRIKPVPFIASWWTKWLHWDSSQRSVSSMNATYLSGCHSAYLSFIARINTSLPSSCMSCPTSKSMSRF